MNREWMRYTTKMMLCASILVFAGCGQVESKKEVPTLVYVTAFHQSQGHNEVLLTGSIRSRSETAMGFRVGGKVLKRMVNVGDHVKKNQLLATLDSVDYQLAVGVAAEQLEAAKVTAEQAMVDAARFKRLGSDGSIAIAEIERQQTRANAARATMEQAKQQLELAKNKVEYTALKAPFDGVITSLNFEEGHVVSEGQPLIFVAKKGEYEVAVDLPEHLVSHVKAYKTTATSWNDASISFNLTMRELSSMATPQGRMYPARYVPSRDALETIALLPLGSTVKFTLSRPMESGTTLPISAVIKTKESAGVWALNSAENGVEFVPVNILNYGTRTVRVTGLKDGIKVVSVGAQKLDASMKVQPIERPYETVVEIPRKGAYEGL
ncbi:Multidrug resistance protein MdtA [Sulfurospirillum diekertiae]|uniref:Multidrug resistance protein MdtA n=1 Tax=Sulfurospirillum diekertiae TaxID=1854492 RepID=A0A290HUE9_9BACT|nr:efflux RND transporter periplasmic adaptor subunit [Sulfurospirillum diekertiae]ATB69456.1 Multidrug resistance protein MdtA [Sulfurospirillum diekertiae]